MDTEFQKSIEELIDFCRKCNATTSSLGTVREDGVKVSLVVTLPKDTPASFTDNLWKIDDSLQAAMDRIKDTLLSEHPDASGDKLVEISNKLTELRHAIVGMRYES